MAMIAQEANNFSTRLSYHIQNDDNFLSALPSVSNFSHIFKKHHNQTEENEGGKRRK